MDMADTVYTEPLIPELVAKLLKRKYRCNTPTMGGQQVKHSNRTGDLGLLDNIKVLDSNVQTIKDVEDRIYSEIS